MISPICVTVLKKDWHNLSASLWGEKAPAWPERVHAQFVPRALISLEEQVWKLLQGRVTATDVQLQNIYPIVLLIERFTNLLKVGPR